MSLLCNKLGIESVEDLKDVKSYDLHDISYLSWAEDHLSVVERNRFCRAIAFIDNTEWRRDLPHPRMGQASPTLVDGDDMLETRVI